VLRLLLIFKYGVLSYTNMFFTCKNTLICSLLLYRVIVVQIERRRQAMRRFRHWASVYHASRGGSDAASSSVVRLVTMAKSASSIASSATAILRRSQSSGPQQQQQEDPPPSYVVLPRYDTTQELLANAEDGLTSDNAFTASTPAAAAANPAMETEKEKEAMIDTMVNEAMKYNRSMSVEYKQLHLDNSPAVVNYTIKKHRHRRHLQEQKQQQQQEQQQNHAQVDENEKSIVEDGLENDASNSFHDDNVCQSDSDKNVSASNCI
jgi:Transmembrane protein 26